MTNSKPTNYRLNTYSQLFLTPENAFVKCAGFIKSSKDDYNLYKAQKNAIAQGQAKLKDTVAQ